MYAPLDELNFTDYLVQRTLTGELDSACRPGTGEDSVDSLRCVGKGTKKPSIWSAPFTQFWSRASAPESTQVGGSKSSDAATISYPVSPFETQNATSLGLSVVGSDQEETSHTVSSTGVVPSSTMKHGSRPHGTFWQRVVSAAGETSNDTIAPSQTYLSLLYTPPERTLSAAALSSDQILLKKTSRFRLHPEQDRENKEVLGPEFHWAWNTQGRSGRMELGIRLQGRYETHEARETRPSYRFEPETRSSVFLPKSEGPERVLLDWRIVDEKTSVYLSLAGYRDSEKYESCDYGLRGMIGEHESMKELKSSWCRKSLLSLVEAMFRDQIKRLNSSRFAMWRLGSDSQFLRRGTAVELRTRSMDTGWLLCGLIFGNRASMGLISKLTEDLFS
ncbi:hypothetical protein BCR39DRAFT_213001 [Naematelia encephala]|uniref:Uncharacterized protein n=1 Tax=Naematelia encephala TaxID=71784 RepID=A0A1Y2AZL5_9TREE|nr:hypothetical protein BCR39DRAFT_213001 [Naematelia encephala]